MRSKIDIRILDTHCEHIFQTLTSNSIYKKNFECESKIYIHIHKNKKNVLNKVFSRVHTCKNPIFS